MEINQEDMKKLVSLIDKKGDLRANLAGPEMVELAMLILGNPAFQELVISLLKNSGVVDQLKKLLETGKNAVLGTNLFKQNSQSTSSILPEEDDLEPNIIIPGDLTDRQYADYRDEILKELLLERIFSLGSALNSKIEQTKSDLSRSVEESLERIVNEKITILFRQIKEYIDSQLSGYYYNKTLNFTNTEVLNGMLDELNTIYLGQIIDVEKLINEINKTSLGQINSSN